MPAFINVSKRKEGGGFKKRILRLVRPARHILGLQLTNRPLSTSVCIPATRILENVLLTLWFSAGSLIFDCVDIRVRGSNDFIKF